MKYAVKSEPTREDNCLVYINIPSNVGSKVLSNELIHCILVQESSCLRKGHYQEEFLFQNVDFLL